MASDAVSRRPSCAASQMRLEHLSQRRVEFVPVQQTPGGKPVGLWSSQGQWELLQSIHNEANGTLMYDWKCVLRVDSGKICGFPWVAPEEAAPHNLIRVDMSDEAQLDAFVARFRADGKARDVDWARVQGAFAGAVFANVESMPGRLWRRYNDPDGCWAISLTVDSACVWDPSVIASRRWSRRRRATPICKNP